MKSQSTGRKMKPNAVLVWKGRGSMAGRVLKCNGVDVARIIDIDRERWFVRLGTSLYVSREYARESTARRAVNRRFNLPSDFGVK
jgi:hypothetical protein